MLQVKSSNFQRKPIYAWVVIYPGGKESDQIHYKYEFVIDELLEDQKVNREVVEHLISNRTFDMSKQQEKNWILYNTVDIAKKLGYSVKRVTQ